MSIEISILVILEIEFQINKVSEIRIHPRIKCNFEEMKFPNLIFILELLHYSIVSDRARLQI